MILFQLALAVPAMHTIQYSTLQYSKVKYEYITQLYRQWPSAGLIGPHGACRDNACLLKARAEWFDWEAVSLRLPHYCRCIWHRDALLPDNEMWCDAICCSATPSVATATTWEPAAESSIQSALQGETRENASLLEWVPRIALIVLGKTIFCFEKHLMTFPPSSSIGIRIIFNIQS